MKAATVDQINKTVRRLNAKKTTGPDKVLVNFMKSMKGCYITLLHLFQIIFCQISSLLTEKDELCE